MSKKLDIVNTVNLGLEILGNDRLNVSKQSPNFLKLVSKVPDVFSSVYKVILSRPQTVIDVYHLT